MLSYAIEMLQLIVSLLQSNTLSLIASDAEQGESCILEDIGCEDPGYATEEKHWKDNEAESQYPAIGTVSANPLSTD